MNRLFNFGITELGILLVVCGLVCILLALTRRAYSPKASFFYGILMLIFGGLMWLLPRLSINREFLSRLGLLLGGVVLVSIDLVNYYKRLKCTVPWQGEFQEVSTYGRRKSGLSYGAAIFHYWVDGVSYQQASLDKRCWPGFLTSPFLKKFTAGNYYSIYLDPGNPRNFALSKRFHFGLFSFAGLIMLASFVLL